MSDVTFDPPEPEDHPLEFPAALPVLPLKETVVFPQSMSPLAIGQERSVRLIDDVVAGDRLLALITTKDATVEAPTWDDIYEIGTVALVHKMIKVPDGTLRILVQGLERIKLEHRLDTDPYLLGEFSALPDVLIETPEVEALTRNVQGTVRAHHRARAVPPRGAAARRRERRRSERALPPRRLDAAHDQDRGAPGDPRRGRTSSSGCASSRRS